MRPLPLLAVPLCALLLASCGTVDGAGAAASPAGAKAQFAKKKGGDDKGGKNDAKGQKGKGRKGKTKKNGFPPLTDKQKEQERQSYKQLDCRPEAEQLCGLAGFICNAKLGEFCGSRYVVGFENGTARNRFYQCFTREMKSHCPEP